jgi:hypothetical protein
VLPPDTNFGSAMNKAPFFIWQQEKTYLDKVLSKDDNSLFRELFKRDNPTRTDISEMVALACGSESKLLNFSADERYISLVHSVDINPRHILCEYSFDSKDKIYEKMTAEQKVLYDQAHRMIVLMLKNAIRFFRYCGHTSMSLDSKGFGDLTKAKFEMDYRAPMPDLKRGTL